MKECPRDWHQCFCVWSSDVAVAELATELLEARYKTTATHLHMHGSLETAGGDTLMSAFLREVCGAPVIIGVVRSK